MKDWFKARNVWGATILALSDEEAGKIAKAIWAYTMNGELIPLEGSARGIFPMILLTLQQDEERDSDISAKRSNAAKNMHLQANASNCIQMQASASNCTNKNKNKNIEKEPEQESESYISDAEAMRVQQEQSMVIGWAEDAGFKMSNDVRNILIALYADNGLEKMLDGFKSCVEHGAPNIAYLKACLKGEPRKERRSKTVAAQEYNQRDYSDEDNQAMIRMLKVVSK